MKRINLSTLCAAVIAALCLTGTALAATETAPMEKKSMRETSKMTEQGKLDRNDQEFLKKAAQINLTEIELGKVAEKMSSDPKIKKMAESIVKDHMEANRKLERLAASKGVTLPTEPSLWERKSLALLEKETGDKFNKEFLSFNVKGHEKAISLYEKESARTQDPDIKAWAQKMVPELKEHLSMAKSGGPEAVAEKPKSETKHKKSQGQ